MRTCAGSPSGCVLRELVKQPSRSRIPAGLTGWAADLGRACGSRPRNAERMGASGGVDGGSPLLRCAAARDHTTAGVGIAWSARDGSHDVSSGSGGAKRGLKASRPSGHGSGRLSFSRLHCAQRPVAGECLESVKRESGGGKRLPQPLSLGHASCRIVRQRASFPSRDRVAQLASETAVCWMPVLEVGPAIGAMQPTGSDG